MAIHFSNSPAIQAALFKALLGLGFVAFWLVGWRIIHCLFWHPLRHFPGPWYAACSSLPLGLASITSLEPDWLMSLVRKYGKDGKPIRITPSLLFFHKASALPEIYWNAKCNTKSSTYGHEALGPKSIFQVMDSQEHKELRKALGGAPWGGGLIKKNWEARVDDLIRLFLSNQKQRIETGEPVILSDKVAEFAADVLTTIVFTEPWGFLANDRDERGLIRAWRDGLALFGLSQRWRFLREVIFPSPLGPYVLPRESDETGNGWLVSQANREIAERERRMETGEPRPDPPDMLQLTLEATVGGSGEDYGSARPLTATNKTAHMTLLIQAGVDTTGSGLGATLRLLLTHPDHMDKVRAEIAAADAKGLLSPVVQYDETRTHLPYLSACIRESLRVNPPIPNIFPRLAPRGGIVIDGTFVPEGTEMTSQAYVVQRDADVFGADEHEFRPERWLGPEEQVARMDAAMYVFGMGARVCMGKEIALMEVHKLVPEIIRRFDIEMLDAGKWVVTGGIASHTPGLKVLLRARN
ncbi:cytochrome P450 17A1 [Diaporthe helianthi]|uniref:Cytochrome P450 17A1 n=1 Tax=Diaporthe helianthi TaxID=158607 RepID=A0A2P5I7X7_DIAHE|nr:cytochrome P450 17A1 [Diaporthe helianthi]